MAELTVGMIGLDTSHCPAFAKLLNNDRDPHHVPGCRVACAYPGFSERFSKSRERVAGFADTDRKSVV